MSALLVLVGPLALLLPSIREPSQEDLRGEIALPRAAALAISPEGDLWLSSKDGRLCVSRDRNRLWSEVGTPARRPGKFDLGGDELGHIGFFDARRALIAGSIGEEDRNQILRTEDGGQTWSFVALPAELSVYDLQVLPDGHAWLVGSTGELFASEDSGATWRSAATPFDGLRRSRSVWFVSPDTGVVGANLNAIGLTQDGGRTWQAITTPADALFALEEEEDGSRGAALVQGKDGNLELQDLPPGHQDPVVQVWILGGRLFALQRGQLFERSLEPDGAWSSVEFEGQAIVAGEAVSGGLVAITADRHVVQISEALQMRSLSSEVLERVPLSIAQDELCCAFLLPGGRVCLLEEGRLQCSSLHTQGPDRTWPISFFDRTADGTLFGTSSTALYRSVDSGGTWTRLLESSGLSDVAAFEDGSGAVVTTEAGLALWTEEHPALVPVVARGAEEHRLSIGVRKGGLWIATSFETERGSKGQMMMRTSDTVLVGPDFAALVYASADEGRSWKRIDRCEGAIVHALWPGSDDVLSLCMSNHALRVAELDAATGDPASDGFQGISRGGELLGGQWATWLAFPLPSEGWVGGSLYFGDPMLHRTQDGGRTWQAVEAAEDRVIKAYRLGSGACVRVAGFWSEQGRAEVWRDGAFHELRRFDVEVHDARVDATGCLLVRLENADVHRLSADAREWTDVGRIEFPRRR